MNPARQSLTRAVNRAIAEGAPVYVNVPAKRYWVYFRGTRNGMYIAAPSMNAAKAEFAAHHDVPANSAYIAAKQGGVR